MEIKKASEYEGHREIKKGIRDSYKDLEKFNDINERRKEDLKFIEELESCFLEIDTGSATGGENAGLRGKLNAIYKDFETYCGIVSEVKSQIGKLHDDLVIKHDSHYITNKANESYYCGKETNQYYNKETGEWEFKKIYYSGTVQEDGTCRVNSN